MEIRPNKEWLDSIPSQTGWYIAGFVDGEGSFNISMRQRNDFSRKWQITLTFNVSQRDESNLVMMKKLFGIGRLQYRSDGVCYFVVSNPKEIVEKVVPFFNLYNFSSTTKQTNFGIFKRVAKMMVKGEHLNDQGLLQIIKLREEINKGRGKKRKYELYHYLNSQESSEAIRRTSVLPVKI